MAQNADDKTIVVDIARMLDEHRGENTVVLNVTPIAGWTDYFIISTATSVTHLEGLLRWVNEYLQEHSIVSLNSHKNLHERGWILIDCGDFIIHLMEREQREFYELERLWFKAELIYSSSSDSS